MDKVKIFGHRGCMGTLPENTLTGFQKAIEYGVDGLEIDVHLTKDGELVVIHDVTIDRTTDGSGFIKDMTLKELKAVRILDRVEQRGTDVLTVTTERIPTLREVLDLLAPYQHIELNIELKTYKILYDGIEEKLLSFLNQYGEGRNVIYSSFHLPSLFRINGLDSTANVALLLNQIVPHPYDYVNTFNLEGLHLNSKLFLSQPSLFANARNIRIWTVNEEDEIKKVMKHQVDAIITDYPEKAISIRKKIFKRK